MRAVRLAILFACSSVFVASSLGAASASASTAPKWYAPLLTLPRPDLPRAECVMLRESTSTLEHPNLADDNGDPGQSGIFQMSNQPNGVWDLYALPVLHVQIWRATAFQQAEGFVLVVRKDGFEPWHQWDGC
jgi:hypothetical protein